MNLGIPPLTIGGGEWARARIRWPRLPTPGSPGSELSAACCDRTNAITQASCGVGHGHCIMFIMLRPTALFHFAQSQSKPDAMMKSPRFAPALLGTILIWEFFVLCLRAGAKPFWYDELLTFYVSRLQPFSYLLKALREGADGMTPAYYAIVRLGSMLPGSAHVVLRVPSILGYILSLLGVYWFIRKRLPPFAGVVAVLLITVSPFRWYATEARCYALLTGFVAISAVFWQRIDERRFMTPLFAVFLALAASCHPLAVVIISAFGAAELILSVLSRRIRWGVWAACLFAAAPFLMELPMLLRFRVLLGAHYWSLPSWSTLIVTYEHYLGFGYDITFLIVALIGMSVGAA